MSYVPIISFQTMVMFALMAIGYLCFRVGLINATGSRQISNLAIYVANPALLVNAFAGPMPWGLGQKALICVALIAGVYVLSLAVTACVFKRSQRLDRFAVIFANLGFIGIPLAQSVLGNEAVFYMSLFVGISNVLVWTYGVYLVAGANGNTSLWKIVGNPSILALVVGLVLVVTHFKLPPLLDVVVVDLANMNLPLVMIALGCYLAEGDVGAALRNKQLYLTCFWRLIAMPLVIILLFKAIPQSLEMVKLTVLLGSATPAAALLAIFSKEYGGDYLYGTAVVGISTAVSMVTIPVMIAVAGMVW